MIRRVTIAAAAAPLFVLAELCRRGYGSPLLFGVRQHCRSRPGLRDHEPDVAYEPDVVA